VEALDVKGLDLVPAAIAGGISHAPDFNIHCDTDTDSNECNRRFGSTSSNKRMFNGKMRSVVPTER
jgi:hypothetical protein